MQRTPRTPRTPRTQRPFVTFPSLSSHILSFLIVFQFVSFHFSRGHVRAFYFGHLPDVAFPPVDSRFLASIGPLVETKRFPIGNLSRSFAQQLFALCVAAPVNPDTFHHEVMFSVFTMSHWRLITNAICSAQLAGVPQSGYIAIALDPAGFDHMKQLKNEVVLYDTTHLNLTARDLARLKLVIHWHILSWRVDSTIADDDIVFIQDPRRLYKTVSHAEVGGNVLSPGFAEKFDFTQFNVGFFRVISSQTSVRFWKKLIRETFDYPNQLTQIVMFERLKAFRNKSNNSPIQTYDMKGLIQMSEFYKIRFYDPMDVMNCGLFIRLGRQLPNMARQRNVTKPYLIHAAYLRPTEKEPMLTSRQLWWIDSEGRCTGVKPEGAKFKEWLPPMQNVTVAPALTDLFGTPHQKTARSDGAIGWPFSMFWLPKVIWKQPGLEPCPPLPPRQ